jgi:hypothetical protein
LAFVKAVRENKEPRRQSMHGRECRGSMPSRLEARAAVHKSDRGVRKAIYDSHLDPRRLFTHWRDSASFCPAAGATSRMTARQRTPPEMILLSIRHSPPHQ